VWLANVQAICSNYIEDGETVALLGAYEDASSYYLNLFPQWEYVPPEHSFSMVHATAIRDVLFNVLYSKGWGDRGEVPKFTDETLEKQDKFFVKNLPDPVADWIKIFRHTSLFIPLVSEYEDNAAYKKSWENSPFPPIFVTADTVVTCAGHVLVVKRGGNPGKGLLALPGGFVRENERVKFAALRELKEETRIKVDKRILESSIVDSDVFDYPGRSLRGRTITHAFHVKLDCRFRLPEVKGSDDAVGAFWLPMMEVMRRADEFFEDHIHIINRFINK
jgi:bifunctional NMN adenylyltransferase/nudix hydrolase